MAAAFDVVVVGAGLAGMGVAYESLGRGRSVCLVERTPMTDSLERRYESAASTGASYKNAGMMELLKPFRTITNSWQMTTVQTFKLLGVPVVKTGMNLLVDNVVEAAGINLAFPHRLHGEALKKYMAASEPHLMPHITVFRDEYGSCAHPETAMTILRKELTKRGCSTVVDEVARISGQGGDWTVHLRSGSTLKAGALVVAAGPQSKKLMHSFFRVNIPTVQVLGVITEFSHAEATDPWFKSLLMGGHSAFSWGLHSVLEIAKIEKTSLEITREHNSPKTKTTHLYISHGTSRRIYVGGPRIEISDDARVEDLDPELYRADMEKSIEYARKLVKFPPSLTRVGTWSGIMCFPEDKDYPLVGPVPGIPGLYLCTAFASAGFREGFGAGMWLARLIFGGEKEALDIKDKEMMADWKRVLPAGRVRAANGARL